MADGWFCSGAIDQTAAIVEGCIEALQYKGQFCQGDYMVDLKDGGAYQIRNLGDVPLWGSCTYRVFSSCGYPTAAITIKNSSNYGEFDVAYASADVAQDRELSFLNDTDTIKWSGSYINDASNSINVLSH